MKRGNREIRLLYLARGDTPGDAWIFLPKEKTLIAGDALPHPVPFGFSAIPSEWLQRLQKAVQLEFDLLIPGHGDVQQGKGYRQTVIGLLGDFKQQVKKSVDQGLTTEQTRFALDMGREKRPL